MEQFSIFLMYAIVFKDGRFFLVIMLNKLKRMIFNIF